MVGSYLNVAVYPIWAPRLLATTAPSIRKQILASHHHGHPGHHQDHFVHHHPGDHHDHPVHHHDHMPTIIQATIMIILQQLTDMSAVQDWTEITR